MRLRLLLAGIFMLTLSMGQAQRNCGSHEHMTELLKDDAYRLQHEQKLQRMENATNQLRGARDGNTIVLPMAVHFQRLKGKNYDKNCLIALAQDQIDILNQDYGGYNVDISNWVNGASSAFPGVSNGESVIQFCLATTNHPSGYGLVEGEPAVTFNQTSGDFVSDFSGYINIFVRGISYLGYSPYGGNGNGDGVVIDDNAFGSGSGCGSVSPNAPYNLGRTLTHELGHFLLLNHIWGPGGQSTANCNDSDLVDDTPNQSRSYGGCPTIGASSCGSTDMHMNFMDYTNDACMYMFSAGQTDRMETYVSSNLGNVVQKGLLVCGGGSTGPTCDDGQQNGQETGVDCGGPDCPPCSTGGCDTPTGLSSTKLRGGRDLRLNWNAVAAANSYDIEIRLSGTTNWVSYSSNTNTILITGVTRRSTYEWRVRSVCSDGISDWATATAQTREAATDNILMYPNPVQNSLYIDLGAQRSATLQVLDMNGRLISTSRVQGQGEISTSELNNGTYLLSIQLGDEHRVEKFNVIK